MERIELVEKLREKANVSYEEAKMALEMAEWDLLDAMVILEQQGKVTPEAAEYTTKQEEKKDAHQDDSQNHVTLGDVVRKMFRGLGKLIQKGNQNYLNIDKSGERFMSLPVTVFVVILFFGFWAVVPLMVVGLFFGFQYSFSGPHLGREDVNNVMGKASEMAGNIKEEFCEKAQKETDGKDAEDKSDGE